MDRSPDRLVVVVELLRHGAPVALRAMLARRTRCLPMLETLPIPQLRPRVDHIAGERRALRRQRFEVARRDARRQRPLAAVHVDHPACLQPREQRQLHAALTLGEESAPGLLNLPVCPADPLRLRRSEVDEKHVVAIACAQTRLGPRCLPSRRCGRHVRCPTTTPPRCCGTG